MFDVDVDGKVLDIYTYSGEPLSVYSEKLDDFVNVAEKWNVAQNSAFVHCPAKIRGLMVKRLLGNSETRDLEICTSDIEEHFDVFSAFVKHYDLDLTTN